MLDARLGDLPSESLGDFGGLGDAAPFRDQAWNIDARGEKTAVGQYLDVKSDRCFVHVSVSVEDPRVGVQTRVQTYTGAEYA